MCVDSIDLKRKRLVMRKRLAYTITIFKQLTTIQFIHNILLDIFFVKFALVRTFIHTIQMLIVFKKWSFKSVSKESFFLKKE